MIVTASLRTLRTLVGEMPRGKRAVEAIETAAKRGESLTRQLLAFSKHRSLSPVAIDWNQRLEGIRSLLGGAVGPSVYLEVAAQPGLWPIEADPNELELALVNLAVNARDASPPKARIRITAANVGRVPVGPEPLVGEYVAITVADEGAGIPEDVLPKIFDPFFPSAATAAPGWA
jgi:signal transduction histidine kinase